MFGFRDDFVFSDDDYQYDWLVEDLDRNRRRFIDPNADREKAQTRTLMGVARAVENGGRDAMIHAVERYGEEGDDPDFLLEIPDDAGDLEERKLKDEVKQLLEDNPPPKSAKKQKRGGVKSIKGWARVPTGAETCGWCLMLCSRGPVYKEARTAGLDLADRHALADYDAGQEVTSDDMEEWHEGCDCKVVPVFDTRSWPGKEQADDALELWKEATRLADEELERNPNKKSFVGGRWVKTTRNREAINQMRRLVGG